MSEYPTREIKQKFGDLFNQLSPENLSCDGSLSLHRVQARLRDLRRQWLDLEKEARMKVTEDMVWDWEMSKIKRG